MNLESSNPETIESLRAENSRLAAENTKAKSLLRAAANHMGEAETAPDGEWYRDYYTLTRQNAVLDDECWNVGTLDEYRANAGDNFDPGNVIEVLSFDEPRGVRPKP